MLSQVVVSDYRGLTVEQDTQLRKGLREADVEYKVYKNTMIRLQFKEQNLKHLTDDLQRTYSNRCF